MDKLAANLGMWFPGEGLPDSVESLSQVVDLGVGHLAAVKQAFAYVANGFTGLRFFRKRHACIVNAAVKKPVPPKLPDFKVM